jgi:lysophospholipase L1-like esterase
MTAHIVLARPRPVPPLALAAGALAALLLTQVQRVLRARSLSVQAPAAFGRARDGARRRVLLVGDSTGAGVGCTRAEDSIAARLANDFEDAAVCNLCVAGATVGDVLQAVRGLPPRERFDLVLVLAGGNDVLRRTDLRRLSGHARSLCTALRERSRAVLWAGMANVGLAPLFVPPFSWWATRRTRQVNRLLAAEASACGACFVDFFHERGADPFSADPARFYAADGVHPSAEAYAWCYGRMRPVVRAALDDERRLSRAA